MSSKTKIVVLHMKELIYTGIFILLAILFIVLLVIMFVPESQNQDAAQASCAYVPGVYTSTLFLNNSAVEIEIVLDENNINSISMKHLDDAVTTMYPLIEPSFDDLVSQIYENQDLDNITFSEDTKYTSTLLLNAIKASLNKASVSANSTTEAEGN